MFLSNVTLTYIFHMEMFFFCSAGQKLHRMCLCAESAGDHSAHSGPAQSAAAGHCQNLPERERLRCVREV